MEGGSKPTILGVLKNNRLQRLGHSSHMVKIGMNIMVIELKTVDLTPWGLILEKLPHMAGGVYQPIGLHNGTPQTGGRGVASATSNIHLFPTGLEAGSPRLRSCW